MKEKNSLRFRIAEKLFYLNTIPIIPETMAGLAAYDGSITSPWAIASLLYIVIMTEVDIYIFSQPIEVQKRSWLGFLIKEAMSLFSRTATFLKLDFTDVIRAWKYLCIHFEFVKRMLTPAKPQHRQMIQKVMAIFWYVSMLLCSVLPGVGRIANGIYVKQKKPAFGHVFLIVGCFVRFYLIFKGIAFVFF